MKAEIAVRSRRASISACAAAMAPRMISSVTGAQAGAALGGELRKERLACLPCFLRDAKALNDAQIGAFVGKSVVGEHRLGVAAGGVRRDGAIHLQHRDIRRMISAEVDLD